MFFGMQSDLFMVATYIYLSNSVIRKSFIPGSLFIVASVCELAEYGAARWIQDINDNSLSKLL